MPGKTRSRSVRPAQRRFGAHMSIAGGLHLAFERGAEVGCDAMQVFVKNQRQWKAAPLTADEIKAWETARKATGIVPVVAHATYLINLAAPQDDLWEKSIAAYADELDRCERLGIIGLVVHPGAHCGTGEAAGIKRIAAALDVIHKQTRGFKTLTLLEVTAGQGSCIGYRFEHLHDIIDQTREPERIGVCLDTCHLFAAGYDIASPEGYASTIAQLDEQLGISRVRCIHCNDSKKPLGSRVDRHDHIGKGTIKKAAFGFFVTDPRFFGVPMILETPKEQDARGREWDCINLATLRGFTKPKKK